MVIKIGKKENIRSGRIQLFFLNEWEITLFNIMGKYCFYAKLADSAEADNILHSKKAGNSFYSSVKMPDQPLVVIEKDSIFVLIRDNFSADEQINSQTAHENNYKSGGTLN